MEPFEWEYPDGHRAQFVLKGRPYWRRNGMTTGYEKPPREPVSTVMDVLESADRRKGMSTPRTDAFINELGRRVALDPGYKREQVILEHARDIETENEALRRELAKESSENEVLREQNFAMNKTISDRRDDAFVAVPRELMQRLSDTLDAAVDDVEQDTMRGSLRSLEIEVSRLLAALPAHPDASMADKRDAERWIPVSERLPETEDDVLVRHVVGDKARSPRVTDVAAWIRGNWIFPWDRGERNPRPEWVTHWMPLPAPPAAMSAEKEK